jgi:hypothetical protein
LHPEYTGNSNEKPSDNKSSEEDSEKTEEEILIEFETGMGQKEKLLVNKEKTAAEIVQIFSKSHKLSNSQQEILINKIEQAFANDQLNNNSENICEEDQEGIGVHRFDQKLTKRQKTESWQSIVKDKLRERTTSNSKDIESNKTPYASSYQTNQQSANPDASNLLGIRSQIDKVRSCFGDVLRRGKSEEKMGFSLYQRAMAKKMRLAKKIKEHRQQIESSEISGISFSPSINFTSKSMSRAESPEHRLIKYGSEIEDKKERLKAIQIEALKKSCTFRPEIAQK